MTRLDTADTALNAARSGSPGTWFVRDGGLARARVALCLATIVVGVVVLIGWGYDIKPLKAVLPGLTTMKVNTALGLILAGLGCLASGVQTRRGTTAALMCAALLAGLCLATGLEYGLHVRLSIDEAFVTDPDSTSMPYPGRMSPATALALVTAALAIAILAVAKTRRLVRLAHLMALVPLGICYLVTVGYAYGVADLYNFGPFVDVALHTALSLGLVGAALLLTRYDMGWGSAFQGRPITTSVLVRLLALAVIVPFATGQVIVFGARHSLYQPMFGPALFALVAAVAYAGMAVRAALVMRGAEDEMALAREEVERKTEALVESESQFRTFAQAMPNHIWAASAEGLLYWLNDQAYRYTGAELGELNGNAWAEVVHPDDIGSASVSWASALASGAIYEAEFRIRAGDQAYRWFLVRAEPIRGVGGAIIRWIGTNTDIHERKLAIANVVELNATLEQQVEERTRDRDQLWALSRDLFAILDRNGIFKRANPAWQALYGGKPCVDLPGHRFDAVVHPDDRARFDAHLGSMPEDGQSDIEVRLVTIEGSQRDVSFAIVASAGDFHVSGRDVTEQRRTEDALRQSQKMEAVGQLTGGIAHDFNNMLAGITGSLELMEKRLGQGRYQDIERYINVAQGAAKRAAALTHRLLAFSRRQTLDPRATDVNRLVSGMEELIRRTVGPSVAVEVASAGGLWTTLIDPGQLENTLLNLCINARDAMPGGGRLTIETGNRWLDPRGARERDLEPGQYVSLTVSDNGTGMAPDVVERAFDPFFTTKPIGQGTGLGLSMIYGFVRQSGGQCRIYTEIAKGTAICLYLPRHSEASEHDETHASPAIQTDRAAPGETVLVVDDEPSVRMLVMELLDELGYAAIEAGDGSSGLKILQSNVRIDLLVTDVGLPGMMNGRQMADAGRQTRPGLKVLFITGFAENAVLSHGHLDPGMHVLTKPFAMDLLGKRITDLIAAV